jgi:NADPH-dependent curcumin reductase CurA
VASVRYAASRKLGERGITVINVQATEYDRSVFTRLVDLVNDGKLVVSYDRACSLEELPAAVRELADGARGKVVVKV